MGLLLPFATDGWRSIERFASHLLEHVPRVDHEIEILPVRPPEEWRWWGDTIARRGWYTLNPSPERYDIYHIADQSYAQIARSLPPERTLLTCHDLEFWRRRSLLNAPVRAWIARRMLLLENLVVPSAVVGSEVTELARKMGHAAPSVRVIPNGCGAEFQVPSDSRENRRRWNPEGRPFLLNVADSRWPRKNVEFLGEVLARVRRSFPDILFAQVGPAWETSLRARFEAFGLAGNVITYEGLNGADLAGLYAAAELYLHPSLYEGFGFPLLECMACGTPYVAGNIPVTAELFANSGGLLPFRVEVWADRITGLLRAPAERAALLEEQRLDLARYSLQRQAEDYAEIYRKLVR